MLQHHRDVLVVAGCEKQMMKNLRKIKQFNIAKYWKLILLAMLFGIGISWFSDNPSPRLSPYPDGKKFAFTITSDPDGNRLEDIRPIYDYLDSKGIKTTIAVWVQDATQSTGVPDVPVSYDYGDSCQNTSYGLYMQSLNQKGFEIALHTVSSGNDMRENTIAGYERFKDLFGAYPKMNIMHATNLENVYWGSKVINSRSIQWLIGAFLSRSRIPYGGEDPSSIYFLGDILKNHTKYVRLWGTSDINTLKFNPSMPYHDPQKPYVNYWFSFSDGFNVHIFNELISESNTRQLIHERGACIVYTHFASGFVKNGKLDETFMKRIEFLAQNQDGWFVPASTLLDRLLVMKRVLLTCHDNKIFISNLNETEVNGITILVSPKSIFLDMNGQTIESGSEGKIVLEALATGETKLLIKGNSSHQPSNQYPGFIENMGLLIRRAFVYLSHNY